MRYCTYKVRKRSTKYKLINQIPHIVVDLRLEYVSIGERFHKVKCTITARLQSRPLVMWTQKVEQKQPLRLKRKTIVISDSLHHLHTCSAACKALTDCFPARQSP